MKAIQRAESGEAPWIEKRGPRFGNNRKYWALMKWKHRKSRRNKERTVGRRLINDGCLQEVDY